MSKIVAIMPCRNSDWILGLTARALLMWVDSLVFLDHASTDETGNIQIQLMNEYGFERIVLIGDQRQTWREMMHRDLLLKMARGEDATHIVILDDDELVSGNLLPSIREIVLATPSGSILQLPWLQLRGSINTVHTSGLWGEQRASAAFPDRPEYHWVARNGYDHHHRHPMGRPFLPHCPIRDRSAGIMHLQMASDRRLRWKQYLYKLVERKRWPALRTPAELNKMYDPTAIDSSPLSPVPASWWDPYSHLMQYLDVDAAPWQEAEVRRMLAEDARLADGLTTYGLEL